MPEQQHSQRSDSGAAIAARDAGAGGPAFGLKVALTIIDVARDLARATPAPRGAPYFGLDSEAGYDLRVLDGLCSRGIFRKYEFALQLGSGLGGKARWLAARFGCRIVGVDPQPATVAAATLLNRRARMDDHVMFQVGRLDGLPLRQRVFTHVWIVDVLRHHDVGAVFAEAFRVLRPGAQVALHDGAAPRASGDELVGALRAVGFVDVEVRETSLPDLPHTCRVAQDRLRIAAQAPGQAAMDRLLATLSAHEQVALQIFGRRPS